MKILIPNYIFNASAKQITFPTYTALSLSSFLIITDTTVNKIIYNFADPTAGGTVSGNILTLTYNTVGLSNSDQLLIYYDDGTVQARDTTLQLMENQNDLLRRMVKLLESQGTVDLSNRQRVSLDAAPAALTIGVINTGIGTFNSTLSTATTSNGWQVANGGAGFTPYALTNLFPMPVAEGPVGQEWRIADNARNTFANAIRPNIK